MSVMSESFLIKSLMLPTSTMAPPGSSGRTSTSPQTESPRSSSGGISGVVDLRFSLPAHTAFPYPSGFSTSNLTSNLPNLPSPCYRHAHTMYDVLCPMCTSHNSAAGLSMLQSLSARYLQQQHHLHNQQRLQQSQQHQISLQMAAKFNNSTIKVGLAVLHITNYRYML